MVVNESTVKRILSSLANIYIQDSLQELSSDYDLRNFGMNSLTSIELMVKLEKEFNITIPDDNLLVENICSINKIIQLVEKYAAE